ncbi:MAG: hypothetical protein ILA26_06540 [Methanobrevibacter sp.]|uniref:hypothetical protein n=1 Tax=Methanobrevibacter sp. TaxID=66852 RepID=UPI001B416992|nr:hypothetical protein [Methanobrevibacter sp.]MBP3791670.1 hypothetical protein [Methanobrevibacter sp.]
MLILSCGIVAAADNGTGDSLSEDSNNDNALSESSDSEDQSSDDQSSEDSSADSSSDSEDEDVNTEIDVDVIYDRNVTNDDNASTEVPSKHHNPIDLTVHETSNPIVFGLIAIIGIFLPFRGRI